MVNYQCNAACRHCLYACSPKRDNGYMDETTATRVAKVLRQNGCRSVHIGGGEPFLHFDKLIKVIKSFNKCGLGIDYIETNAFWAKDKNRAIEYIDTLLDYGVDTLCISLDPFHAEYVPSYLPLKLTEYCREYGMGCFLWKQEFLRPLSKLDLYTKHTREEFSVAISNNYIKEMADYYGIFYGGRAVNIEDEYDKPVLTEKLLNKSPCKILSSTNHYHLDYSGRFIPSKCTGIYFPVEEGLKGLEEGKYPVLDSLHNGGVAELYKFAKEKGFVPKEKYVSSCNLCFEIRSFLSKTGEFMELDADHYKASRDYYS